MSLVRHIRDFEIGKAGEVLTKAFFYDDLIKYMFPDEEFRRSFLPWIYTKWIAILASHDSVFVDDEVRGVIVCIPPDLELNVPLWEQIREGLLLTIPKLGMRRIWRPLRVWLDNRRRTKAEAVPRSWVIDILGVSPEYQRKGIGSLLVGEVLNQARIGRVPAYVITHKLENIRFYQKNGFKLIKIVNSLPGGPPTCSLIFNQ